MSHLLSHPNKPMHFHITNVWKIAVSFFEKEGINDEILKDILTIIAFTHDFGKSTEYFQQYIKGDKSLKNKPEIRHAHIGGLLGFYLVEKYLESKNINNPFLKILAYILPKRHHSDLKDFYEDVIIDEKEIKILEEQLKAIDKGKFEEFLNNLDIKKKELLKFELDEINIKELAEKIKKIRREIRKLSKEKSLYYYTTTALLFSYLLDGDKLDAGFSEGKDVFIKEITLPSNLVENFIKKKNFKGTEINKLRTKALNEVLDHKIDLSQKIYSLTLPTGMGKTLISFAFALKLANKIKEEKGIFPKIIYSLPFLSIIEQNFNIFENVLKENGLNADSYTILKHHHLIDFRYRFENNEFDYENSRILVEGWHSQIVITTFIQFFHTLIGYKNKTLRKFHHFTNSVVILDEVQSIPFKYWKVIREIISYLAQKYNFFVIFSTATQPLIFEKTTDLASKEYFNHFNRYSIKVNKNKQTIDEFLDSLTLNSEKSYLFILNTIKQAKKIYKRLSDLNPIYLSTHIIPKERLKRIKKLKNKETKVAISTQLVEAGVDIDFDIVYRDFAPLDSIIQSAGRCNREGLKEKGILNLIYLYDEENNRDYCSYIYDKILLSATKDIFTKKEYEEKEALYLIEKYFKELIKRKSLSDSEKLLECLYSLKFSAEKTDEINSIADFKLIESQPFKTDVFIQTDEEAVQIWEEFKRIMGIKDIFERKKAFNHIKRDFYNHIVSVPIKDNIPPEYNGFYYVPKDNLKDYYDEKTGYKVEGVEFYFI